MKISIYFVVMLITIFLVGACSNKSDQQNDSKGTARETSELKNKTLNSKNKSGSPSLEVLKNDLPISVGEDRTSVIKKLGNNNSSYNTSQTFYDFGLVVTYDADGKVVEIDVTHLKSGTAFDGKVFGVVLGDPVSKCVSLWSNELTQEEVTSSYQRVWFNHADLLIELEVWSQRGKEENFGTYERGTIKSINISTANIPQLIAQLNSESITEREEAASKLGKLGPLASSAIPHLVDRLSDTSVTYESISLLPGFVMPSDSTSKLAAKALCKIDVSGCNAVVKALMHEDSKVRDNMATALGEVKYKLAVPELIKALEDLSWKVRSSAAYALQKIDNTRAIPHLIACLQNEEHDGATGNVVSSLVGALGHFKDYRAVDVLIDRLKEDLPAPYVSDALKEITGQEFGADTERWRKWWTSNKIKFLK